MALVWGVLIPCGSRQPALGHFLFLDMWNKAVKYTQQGQGHLEVQLAVGGAGAGEGGGGETWGEVT